MPRLQQSAPPAHRRLRIHQTYAPLHHSSTKHVSGRRPRPRSEYVRPFSGYRDEHATIRRTLVPLGYRDEHATIRRTLVPSGYRDEHATIRHTLVPRPKLLVVANDRP